jgi:hypothetical protein
MTPEEMDRKIEFIIESQARLAAAQEQDRQERLNYEARMAKLTQMLSDLTVQQSTRMDSLDRVYRDWWRETRDYQRASLRLLNLILDRLSGGANPN